MRNKKKAERKERRWTVKVNIMKSRVRKPLHRVRNTSCWFLFDLDAEMIKLVASNNNKCLGRLFTRLQVEVMNV